MKKQLSKIITRSELIAKITKHIAEINNSFRFYRQEAKSQKINVLKAGLDFLTGKKTRSDLDDVIKENTSYANAIGKSQTKELINQALKFDEIINTSSNEKASSDLEIVKAGYREVKIIKGGFIGYKKV